MADYVIERRKKDSGILCYWAGRKLRDSRSAGSIWSPDLNDAIIVHSELRAMDIISEAAQKDRVYTIRQLDSTLFILQESKCQTL